MALREKLGTRRDRENNKSNASLYNCIRQKEIPSVKYQDIDLRDEFMIFLKL